MIVVFLVLLPFTMGFLFFFTNFDSVYFRFDLTPSPFRLLNFVIDVPSYYASNPGPFDLRVPSQGRGITVGQWNIRYLTDSKFEQLSLSLTLSTPTKIQQIKSMN